MHRIALSGSALLVTALPAAGPADTARQLTFEQRVAAQRAIERVYYSHQEGATRSFEEAVPRDVLEEKVRTYLKQSVALDKFWRTPVTATALSRELERMEAGSHHPDRLHEIYEALDNDSFLIQETFVRASLVGRLARNFFASDERIHGSARGEAERLRGSLAAGDHAIEGEEPRRTVAEYSLARTGKALRESPATDSLQGVSPFPLELEAEQFQRERALAPQRVGEIGPVVEEPEAFVIRTVLAEGPDSYRLGMYRVEKNSWQWWWGQVRDELRDGAVRAVAGASVRPGRRAARGHGDRLWAPHSIAAQPTGLCSTEGIWDNGSLDGSPRQRGGHTTVWTGREMIVWGGSDGSTGDRYDPVTDTWAAISTDGAPSNGPHVRITGSAVWTGTEMIVWTGETGARYNPAEDRWRPMTSTNAPHNGLAVWTGSKMIVWDGRKGGQYDVASDSWRPISSIGGPQVLGTVVWTGREMIIWGGEVEDDDDIIGTNGGARYDPISDTWSPTSRSGAPRPRFHHTAIWTGHVMVVWGGYYNDYYEDSEYLNTGGRYDPASDTWTSTSMTNAPAARSDHGAIWTGSRMIVWGGSAKYDPIEDRWEAISTMNAPKERVRFSAVWTGTLMVVWGGFSGFGVTTTGGRYDPATDVWTPTASGSPGMPSRMVEHSQIWTGNVMIIWGGSPGAGGMYDPLTDGWSAMSTSGSPAFGIAVWAGDEMIVFSGATGARYDPIRDTWRPIATLGAPPSTLVTVLWTGREMIVWGRVGARYHPDSDTWSSISSAGAPTPRSDHTAIWTGSRMIVWGGPGPTKMATGGIYDPSTDSWSPVSTVNAPAARWDHTAVWTGREMIVWGGYTWVGDTNTGARYDPTSDSWAPVSTLAAPSRRYVHTAVWADSSMIVWGGHSGGPVSGPGSRYDPVADAWVSLPIEGAPAPRSGHKAVWTGQEMIIWGGYSGPGGVGGRYYLDGDPDSDGDGVGACAGDCDDGNADVRPGAVDLPGNSLDEDCDGLPVCDSSRRWRSRGQFVGCVTSQCRALVRAGLVTASQCREVIGQARLASVCGDGVREGEESCDGVDLAGRTCEDRGFDAGTLGCNPSCGSFDTSGCTTICGDGLIRGREVCDGGDLDGETCQTQGTFDGRLACSDRCDYDLSGCIFCGNDRREERDDDEYGYYYYEACDGMDLAGESCQTFGYDAGTLACKDSCNFDASGCTTVCGDGIRRGDEACDGSSFGSTTCRQLGFTSGTLLCSSDCKGIDTSGCQARCGDGFRNPSEVCDGRDLTAACSDLGFNRGILACSSGCDGYDTTGCCCWDGRAGCPVCPICGNGVRQAPFEACDRIDFGGETCESQGRGSGYLICQGNCNGFIYTGCTGMDP